MYADSYQHSQTYILADGLWNLINYIFWITATTIFSRQHIHLSRQIMQKHSSARSSYTNMLMWSVNDLFSLHTIGFKSGQQNIFHCSDTSMIFKYRIPWLGGYMIWLHISNKISLLCLYLIYVCLALFKTKNPFKVQLCRESNTACYEARMKQDFTWQDILQLLLYNFLEECMFFLQNNSSMK